MTSHQRRPRFLALVPVLLASACASGDDGAATTAPVIEIADVGFASPESVLADTVADVYYVSNVNGSALGEDDNGFISRVTPDGQVENLKWIDGAGADPAITLNAPKGMAIRGDSLFVADIKCIRIFNRVTGRRANEVCIESATVLNDIAVGPEGSIFVTDSGFREGAGGAFEPTGTDAVYRLTLREDQAGATIARDPDLGMPNGIAVGNRGIFVVTFGSGEVLRFTPNGEKSVLVQGGNRQLDGVVFDSRGGFLFSSWAERAVYHVDNQGSVHTVLSDVESPADIGYDARRNRVLVPQFIPNKVLIADLAQDSAAAR
jgi:hypothetical protein